MNGWGGSKRPKRCKSQPARCIPNTTWPTVVVGLGEIVSESQSTQVVSLKLLLTPNGHEMLTLASIGPKRSCCGHGVLTLASRCPEALCAATEVEQASEARVINPAVGRLGVRGAYKDACSSKCGQMNA